MTLRRRAKAPLAVTTALPEFDDLTAPAWSTDRRVQTWFAQHELRAPSYMVGSGPAVRREYAMYAWLLANGAASERWPKLLEGSKIAELGLTELWREVDGAGRRARWAGARIEEN